MDSKTLKYCLLLATFDISCPNLNDESKENTQSVVSKHVAYIQKLLLAHDILEADEYDDNKGRLPLPTAELSLKHDVAKLSGKLSCCRVICMFVCTYCFKNLEPYTPPELGLTGS